MVCCPRLRKQCKRNGCCVPGSYDAIKVMVFLSSASKHCECRGFCCPRLREHCTRNGFLCPRIRKRYKSNGCFVSGTEHFIKLMVFVCPRLRKTCKRNGMFVPGSANNIKVMVFVPPAHNST